MRSRLARGVVVLGIPLLVAAFVLRTYAIAPDWYHRYVLAEGYGLLVATMMPSRRNDRPMIYDTLLGGED